jgi:hypothetical protein
MSKRIIDLYVVIFQAKTIVLYIYIYIYIYIKASIK